MAEYVSALPVTVLNEQVFQHAITGFKDSQPVLREATVKAMVCMAPHLSERNLNGTLVGCLDQTARDPVPSIRVNTIVALCSIAAHLRDADKEKTIIRFLGRALGDSLPAARKMALYAMQHCTTKQLVSVRVISSHFVPAAAKGCLSSSKDVRNQAREALQAATTALSNHVDALSVSEEPAATETSEPGGASQQNSTPKVAAAPPPRSRLHAPPQSGRSPHLQPSSRTGPSLQMRAAELPLSASAAALAAASGGGVDEGWAAFEPDQGSDFWNGLDSVQPPAGAAAPIKPPDAFAAPTTETIEDGWDDDWGAESSHRTAEAGSSSLPLAATTAAITPAERVITTNNATQSMSLKGNTKKLSLAAHAIDEWDDW